MIANPATRPLVLAGIVSMALHGGVFAGASWLWVPTASPEAPTLVAVAFISEATARPKRHAKRIAAAANPGAAKIKALAALRAAKRRAPPAREAKATAKPMSAKSPAVHGFWGKAPPVPPHPPRFRLGGGRQPPPRTLAKIPTPDRRVDEPVAIKIVPAAAMPGGTDGTAQTAKTTDHDAPGAMARPRPVAGLGNPAPQYPWISRRRGEQGRVILEVAVSADGQALKVRVKRSSGSARLDKAALAAVRTWRFSPARRGGRAVAGRIDIPITFRLTK